MQRTSKPAFVDNWPNPGNTRVDHERRMRGSSCQRALTFSDPILAEMATINFKFFWLSYNY